MKKYFLEKYNASDDVYIASQIYCAPGDQVKKDDLLFSIESSKASIDIESVGKGYVYFNINIGAEVQAGELLYILSPVKLDGWHDHFVSTVSRSSQVELGISVTRKAAELLEAKDIDPLTLNKKIVRESDVIEYLKNLAIDDNSTVCDEKFIRLNADKDNSKSIVIFGAQGGAKMCIDAISNESSTYNIVGLLDDNLSIGDNVLGLPIIGNFEAAAELIKIGIKSFVLAFGVIDDRKYRYELFLKLKRIGGVFPNIIHPKAIIEKSVILGEGNVILAGANIGSCSMLGDLNYVNNNSLISHDCTLSNNIHIAPGAVLASSIKINSHSLIGMNTTLYLKIIIGEQVTIQNGLIINNDVEANTVQRVNN
jgi:sugar O-acyltransferase (sialic acid O-acetyltransferase NeuD family)